METFTLPVGVDSVSGQTKSLTCFLLCAGIDLTAATIAPVVVRISKVRVEYWNRVADFGTEDGRGLLWGMKTNLPPVSDSWQLDLR